MNTERPGDERPVDETVDRAWHEASTEGPSPRLDAAILAAARAEVSRKPTGQAAAGPRRRLDWWTGWQPLAAAATVAGLAFVLVQTIPRNREVAPPIAIEMQRHEAQPVAPSAERSGPSADVAAAAEAAESSEAARALEAPPATVKSNEVAAPPAARSPAAPEAEAPAEVGSTAAAPSGVAAEADAAAGARYRATAPAPSPAVQDWAARIESLYGAGDLTGAATELRAFRAAYPDADRHLPDALRQWAAAVK